MPENESWIVEVESKKKGLATYLRTHVHTSGIIVCEEPKFIYMKPAKTAGTSILRATLEPEIQGIFHRKDHPATFDAWLRRITDEELNNYHVFSVVRNPWDRFVSASSYFGIPFDDFMNGINEHLKKEDINIHCLSLSLYTHNNGVQFADTICRFECLQPDFNLVLDRLGVKRKTLPFVNRSSHKHYSTYYSSAQQERVAELYKNDIRNFGYVFESALANTPEAEPGVRKRLFSAAGRLVDLVTRNGSPASHRLH